MATRRQSPAGHSLGPPGSLVRVRQAAQQAALCYSGNVLSKNGIVAIPHGMAVCFSGCTHCHVCYSGNVLSKNGIVAIPHGMAVCFSGCTHCHVYTKRDRLFFFGPGHPMRWPQVGRGQKHNIGTPLFNLKKRTYTRPPRPYCPLFLFRGGMRFKRIGIFGVQQ